MIDRRSVLLPSQYLETVSNLKKIGQEKDLSSIKRTLDKIQRDSKLANDPRIS